MKKSIRVYNEQYLKIRKIINKWDPMDIIACSCLEDEYDPEVDDIILIDIKIDNHKYGMKIKNIFKKWFNVHLSIDECIEIAIKIKSITL